MTGHRRLGQRNRHHTLINLECQSEHHRASIAEPVMFPQEHRTPFWRPAGRMVGWFGLDQEEFSSIQIAKRHRTGWVGAFIQHGILRRRIPTVAQNQCEMRMHADNRNAQIHNQRKSLLFINMGLLRQLCPLFHAEGLSLLPMDRHLSGRRKNIGFLAFGRYVGQY
jgi:hypothetical protein